MPFSCNRNVGELDELDQRGLSKKMRRIASHVQGVIRGPCKGRLGGEEKDDKLNKLKVNE